MKASKGIFLRRLSFKPLENRNKRGMKMDRINKILNNEKYRHYVQLNEKEEKTRKFCRHDMAHFLDVARIAFIFNLEKGLGLEKEIVYAAALLHDIGKHLQYTDGIAHEEASAWLAPPVLAECEYNKSEILLITEAILKHRDKTAAGEANLAGILYCADKASRPCFSCSAEKECNWETDKKNSGIKY